MHCLVLAEDASARARDRVFRLAQARGVTIIAGPPSDQLGRQLGLPPVMAAGVVDPALAAGVAQAAAARTGRAAQTED